MRKTTLYLEESLHQQLLRIAEKRGVTQALVVREALARYVAPTKRKPKSVGMGRSGAHLKGRLSQRAEELLEGMGSDT